MIFVVLVVLVLDCATSKNLPSYITPCKRNDPDLSKCFIETVEKIRPNLLQGIPEFEIPPIDPYPMPPIDISTGEGQAVSFDCLYENGTMEGGKDFKVRNFSIKFEGKTSESSVEIYFPFVRITGDYRMKGKIMMFPIDASGICEGNFTGVVAICKWKGKLVDRNGKDYITFDDVSLELQTKSALVNFGNIFGDFSDTANQAFNANMDVLKEEMTPIAGKILGQVLHKIYNRVFELFPADVLFPEV